MPNLQTVRLATYVLSPTWKTAILRQWRTTVTVKLPALRPLVFVRCLKWNRFDGSISLEAVAVS